METEPFTFFIVHQIIKRLRLGNWNCKFKAFITNWGFLNCLIYSRRLRWGFYICFYTHHYVCRNLSRGNYHINMYFSESQGVVKITCCFWNKIQVYKVSVFHKSVIGASIFVEVPVAWLTRYTSPVYAKQMAAIFRMFLVQSHLIQHGLCYMRIWIFTSEIALLQYFMPKLH